MDGLELGGRNRTSEDRSDLNGRHPSPCQGEGRGFESRLPLHRSRSERVFQPQRDPTLCAWRVRSAFVVRVFRVTRVARRRRIRLGRWSEATLDSVVTENLNTAREASSTPKRRRNLGNEGWNDQRAARRVQLRAACWITAATVTGCDTTAVGCEHVDRMAARRFADRCTCEFGHCALSRWRNRPIFSRNEIPTRPGGPCRLRDLATEGVNTPWHLRIGHECSLLGRQISGKRCPGLEPVEEQKGFLRRNDRRDGRTSRHPYRVDLPTPPS
jgi:hypothetical protein